MLGRRRRRKRHAKRAGEAGSRARAEGVDRGAQICEAGMRGGTRRPGAGPQWLTRSLDYGRAAMPSVLRISTGADVREVIAFAYVFPQ